MKALRAIAAAVALFNLAATEWDPGPWVKDLDQAQAAVHGKYANLDWLEQERQVDVDALFARARTALGKAHGEAEARSVFEHRHVWP
jgi:hypothetical protein